MKSPSYLDNYWWRGGHPKFAILAGRMKIGLNFATFQTGFGSIAWSAELEKLHGCGIYDIYSIVRHWLIFDEIHIVYITFFL